MHPVVILLALATLATGTAENIVVGILPEVAEGLDVTPAAAGQLTGVFSLSFAGFALVVPVLAARIPVRVLYCSALGLFAAGNLVLAAGPSFAVVVAARSATAVASAAIALLGTMIITQLVPAELRGRAIGIIFMGVSGSLVLGVPAGIALADAFGWRGVFAALALAALVLLALSGRLLPREVARAGDRPRYLDHLRRLALTSGQCVSILLLGGHFVLFAFLSAYLAEVVGLPESLRLIAFTLLGVAGVSGGYLGGWLVDRTSPRLAIVVVPAAYVGSLLAVIVCAATPWLQFGALMVWACISWMISPVVQSFLIAADPGTSDAGLGLNFAAMHIGVALGTVVGGLVLASATVAVLPYVGLSLAGLSVLAGLIATRSSRVSRTGPGESRGGADL